MGYLLLHLTTTNDEACRHTELYDQACTSIIIAEDYLHKTWN